jgi:hypothetical protein
MYNSFRKAIREKIVKAYFLLMALNLEKRLFWPVNYQIMVPIQIQIMPNAPIIIRATKRGLNNMVESLTDSDIASNIE